MFGPSLSTRETVWYETPARAATSRMFGIRSALRSLGIAPLLPCPRAERDRSALSMNPSGRSDRSHGAVDIGRVDRIDRRHDGLGTANQEVDDLALGHLAVERGLHEGLLGQCHPG